MKMKTRIQSKETFKRVLFWSSMVMVVCLLFIGYRYRPIYYYNRGVAHHDKGQYDQAISDYSKTIELFPGYAEVYCNRGVAYKNKGQYDLAISDYNKAIELNPRDALAYSNRGVAYADNSVLQ